MKTLLIIAAIIVGGYYFAPNKTQDAINWTGSAAVKVVSKTGGKCAELVKEVLK